MVLVKSHLHSIYCHRLCCNRRIISCHVPQRDDSTPCSRYYWFSFDPSTDLMIQQLLTDVVAPDWQTFLSNLASLKLKKIEP
ncbi:MAG: hypothetical protein ACK518_00515 [bacterium]